MARIALMALGQVVGSDIRKSISELAKLSARDSWLPFYPAHWVMTVCKLQWDNWVGGNIAKYKKGEMTTPEFTQVLRNKFSSKATDQELHDAWNVMCKFDDHNLVKSLANYLVGKQDFKLGIIGVTNELHWQFIEAQIQSISSALIFMMQPGQRKNVITTLSFKEETLDVGCLVRKSLEGLDIASNTVYSFIHTLSSIPGMGLNNAKVVLCQFDRKKTFEEMIAASESKGHQKTL